MPAYPTTKIATTSASTGRAYRNEPSDTNECLAERSEEQVLRVDQGADDDEDLDDDGRHFLDPLHGRVLRVDIALDERIRDHRLRAADVRPAAAERVAGDLRHREELQHVDVEPVQG